MTTGDAAGAAGLYVVPATKDYRLGYDDINRRGDELANHMVNGGHPASKITGQITTSQIKDGAVGPAKLGSSSLTDAGGAASTGWYGSSEFDQNSTLRFGPLIQIYWYLRKNSGDAVVFDGTTGGTDDVTLMTLGSAYAPTRRIVIPILYRDGSGDASFIGGGTIETGGAVVLRSGAPGTSITNRDSEDGYSVLIAPPAFLRD